MISIYLILPLSLPEIAEDDQLHEEAIKYPIDDLLVQPGVDDPVFTDRPAPLRDFNVPMKFVGDLLMVWDYCSSFGRLLRLSPYSLEDFESAICQEKGNVILLVETHAALLRMLIKDNGEYFLAFQKRNRTSKVKTLLSIFSSFSFLCTKITIFSLLLFLFSFFFFKKKIV